MKLAFVIEKWTVWPPLQSDDEQIRIEQDRLLSGIPKLLKRRLSSLAKSAFCAAYACIDEIHAIPSVFSSSHGELTKSFTMLESIEAGEDVSPTNFSLSVHNSIAGLYSMASQNTLQSTVVAPGEDGMVPAFLEALGLLQEGAKQVLVVFYDEPIVAFYPTAPYKSVTDQRCALALRMSNNGDGIPLILSCSENTGDDGEQPWQIPLFIRFLKEAHSSLTLKTPRCSWHWARHAKSL